ncbi:hypothetical protein [Geodermatophilus sp. Leaf369]|nr:hypothetical protein [Geodermatophilus sp. Leaf369]
MTDVLWTVLGAGALAGLLVGFEWGNWRGARRAAKASYRTVRGR